MGETTVSWTRMVVEADPDHYKPDEVVYEFGDGREFTTTDHTDSGVYE